ncbi:MAG: ATP-binding cassette domain-containing protein [Candidatus Asgardarchaeia archaeon]
MSLDNIPKEVETHQIVIRDLIRVYHRGAEEVIALRGIDLEVKKGEFVTIVGPSGSGKTTLVRIIGGLDKPTAGRIWVDKKDITRYNEAQLLAYRRKKVGFVWQFGNLIENLTALQNVMLPMKVPGVRTKIKNPRERAEMLLKRLGLEDRMHHKPYELSGGEAQRVAIAVALANNPAILLGDELTGELDTETAKEVLEYIQELNKEMELTVIIVTHNPFVAKFGERMLRIRDGMFESLKHKALGEIVEIDAKGRLVIPEGIREIIGLKRVAQLIVQGNTLIVKPLEAPEETS